MTLPQLLPFAVQHPHNDLIPPPTIQPEGLPQPALDQESDLLVDPLRARIPLEHMQLDAMQIGRLEGPLDGPDGGFGAVALAVVLALDLDAQHRTAMMGLVRSGLSEG